MFNIAVVEAQCRASDIVTYNQIQHFALDPIYARQFDATHHTAAALEKRAYMQDSGTTDEAIAKVAVKNYNNALSNPIAAYGTKVTLAAQIGHWGKPPSPRFGASVLSAGHV